MKFFLYVLGIFSFFFLLPLVAEEGENVPEIKSQHKEEVAYRSQQHQTKDEVHKQQGRLRIGAIQEQTKQQKTNQKQQKMRKQGRLHQCHGKNCNTGTPHEGDQKQGEQNTEAPTNDQHRNKSSNPEPYRHS